MRRSRRRAGTALGLQGGGRGEHGYEHDLPGSRTVVLTARIVADHFHVIQHVNKALNKVIGRWAKKAEGKQALEGQRYLFLRNQEDLCAEDEQSRATQASTFPEIGRAWLLKEALRTWYASTEASTAAADLDSW